MQVKDFHFDLPDELIARYPLEKRSDSRLFCVDGNSGEFQHRQFFEVLDLLEPGDLVVFNNTRVIPARMFGQKASGGKIEVLIERVLDERSALAHIRSSRSPKPLKNFVSHQGGYSWTKMAKSAHIHLFGIAVFLVLVSMTMAYSSYAVWIKILLITAGWIGLWLDIASWWLTKFFSGFAYVISVAGSVEIGAVCAMSGLCLLNLWFPLPAILLEPAEHEAD